MAVGIIVILVGISFHPALAQTIFKPLVFVEETSNLMLQSWEFPGEEWNNTYGTSSTEKANHVIQTNDGGYIFVGEQALVDTEDMLVIKTDANGTQVWSKTYGGGNSDFGNHILQTADGGYLISGTTQSYANGLSDMWVIRIDANGSELWNQSFGGSSNDEGHSSITVANGFLIVGGSMNYSAGFYDVWLIQIDGNGTHLWNQSYGGIDYDIGFDVIQTTDNGYVIAGCTASYRAGIYDALVIKTDVNGSEQWNQTFGDTSFDYAYSVKETQDGGLIIAGETYVGSTAQTQAWLIKTDENGVEQWSKTYGGANDDCAESVIQTVDASYLVVGSTNSYGSGNTDLWLIKTFANGTEQWNTTLGGGNVDSGKSLQLTQDFGYILCGSTISYGSGGYDAWLIKILSENHPPYEPSDPHPSDGATDVELDENLSWAGGDPDPGDTVLYDVYFGTTNPPPQVVSQQAETYYSPILTYDTTFYWKIVSWDSYNASTIGPIWSFKTKEMGDNTPPVLPFNPIPISGATGVLIDASLSWDCFDPDEGDTLTYDVYFGTTGDPPKVSSNQTQTEYEPDLDYSTKYYWYIVAWDNHGEDAKNITWSFTTTDDTELTVNITSPEEKSLYVYGNKILDLPFNTIVYGLMKVEATASSKNGIEKVQFYVDGDLKETVYETPYEFHFGPIICKKYTIQAKATDSTNNTISDFIEVIKWRPHPIAILLILFIMFRIGKRAIQTRLSGFMGGIFSP